ncbi:hypothetical protein F4802DRAFT_155321 [Xylaria palmicola]|nr:hypothetical protein F4802DRAFT_155321 [Xylaria palmicola]
MLSQKFDMIMADNASSSERPGSSAKPFLGQNQYSLPASPAGPAITAPDAARAPAPRPVLSPSQTTSLANSGLNTQPYIPQHLRSAPPGLASDMMQRGASSTSEELGPVSNSPTSSTMAAQAIMSHEHDESITDGRKVKRELSQSKRAAQNRAAQRAFRQRKEHYIKKLEQQVRDFTEMEHAFKNIQNDNYALREYVIQLQSRLLDLQVELPQPPPNVNITPPGPSSAMRQPHSSGPVDPAPSATSAGTLADVAAAVAGLRAREPVAEGTYGKPTFKAGENASSSHPNDETQRQLQADGLPPPSSISSLGNKR